MNQLSLHCRVPRQWSETPSIRCIDSKPLAPDQFMAPIAAVTADI